MDIIEFGKVVNTHGLKGDIKVYSYTDNVENILSLKKIYINSNMYKVQKISIKKNMFTIKLEGIDSIEATKPLIDKMCYREVVTGESNEAEGYFIKDLIGIQVVDESGNDLGVLKEVYQTGANDVYEVVNDSDTIYIPAIKDVVLDIDINSKVMKIKLMEGLI